MDDKIIKRLQEIDYQYEDLMRTLGWETWTKGARAVKRFYMSVIKQLLLEIYKEKEKNGSK